MTATMAQPAVDLKEDRAIGEALWQTALRRLRRDHLTLLAMGTLLLLATLSVLAPVISDAVLHVDPNHTDIANKFLPIGAPGHWLGTDDLGRDHLSRLLHAGQISLGIGFSAAALTMTIGLTLGIVTGYYGGAVDDFVNWIITTLDSIPSLFLLLIIAAVLSPSPGTLVLVLASIGWTGITRLVRGETIALRSREFIISAQSVGASNWRIMFIHIMPNLFSIVAVTLAIGVGNLILVESGLSFLGLGVKPPTATWGNMLSNAQTFFTKGPHLVILPGLLIVITVLCLYVIGDGIRDAFDPAMKR